MAPKAAKKKRAPARRKRTRAAPEKAPPAGECPLTGLPYRRRARRRWEAALEEALERGEAAVFALIDIDEFARHAQELGAERADAVLRGVADRLREALGEAAAANLGRLAGDCYGVVLRGVEVEEALGLLERVRGAVSRAPLRVGRGVRKRQAAVAVSVGVAGLRRDGADLRALLVAAQGALRRAKALGGNRCALAERERMTLKSSYYPGHQLAELKQLARELGVKEAVLLREALDDLFLKYKDR
ncbi:MAG: diguanylate cyclase, partial [Planctomycetota bacterium]